jgi:hypothetical protein
MREVVINAIIATDAAEKKVIAFATAAAAGQSEILDVNELMKKFREIYRRRNYKDVEEHDSTE